MSQENRTPRRRRRRRSTGRAAGFAMLYIVCVIGISVVLAALCWIAANDVLALNKEERSVTITVDSEDTFDDVVDGVAQKMVFRHPHVFGTAQAEDTEQALVTWDAQKQVEKDQKTAGDTLDAVARSLPALIRAEKIQKKAQKAGFDWDNVNPVLDKLSEEVEELKQAGLIGK